MTPLELKQEKQAKNFLRSLTNKVKADFSFGKIKNLEDYLLAIGNSKENIRRVLNYRDNELAAPLSFKELKDKLDDLRIGVETEWWLKHNPPETNHADIQIDKDISSETKVETQVKAEHDKDYGLPPSEKETCNLFWFQKKEAKALLDGIDKGSRAQLLIASAGLGKTYIAGAVLRRLKDREFEKGKSVSPWPYFYITKASVVEQTKRVLESKFGLSVPNDIMVTNYDQLRATLGTLYIEEKMVVEEGYEHLTYNWRPVIHPIVFLIDESQAAKNRDSQQSKIIRAIAKIESEHVHCIFMSATPWVRVSESEYFIVNCRLDEKVL